MDARNPPGAVSFHESLEILASRRRSCEIVFRSANGARTVVRDRIAGLSVREGKEGLKTASGLEIDLDRLVEVDGRAASGAC